MSPNTPEPASSSPEGPLTQALAAWRLEAAAAPLALEGPLGGGKSAALRAHYQALLASGVPAERILVWLPNFAQANAWRDVLMQHAAPYGEAQLHTFRSWVRRELLMNWPLVETSGLLLGPPSRPEPFFIGLTAAQQLLRDMIEPLAAEFPVLERCYTVAAQRMIQVLDTYSRLVEHGLPVEEASVRLDRSHFLGPDSEELHRFIGAALAQYRSFCLTNRVLDYSTQLDLFSRALWASPRYRERLKQEIDHLIVDNLEETLPVAQDVIAQLMQAERRVVLASDTNGGLREYLGGDPTGARALLQACTVEHAPGGSTCGPAKARFASALAAIVQADLDDALPAAVAGTGIVLHPPRTLRVQMFEALGKRLKALFEAGYGQNDIVVVAPVVDPLLSWHLRQALNAQGKQLRVLSGSNRVIDHRPVRILVTLARLARPAWQAPPAAADVAEALEVLLELHPLEAPHLAKLVYVEDALLPPDEPEWPKHLMGRYDAYAAVHAWVSAVQANEDPLDRIFEHAFASLYAPRRLRALAPDPDVAGNAVASPYAWTAEQATEILQVDQLIQGARSYRQLAKTVDIPAEQVAKRFLKSIYAGELAERPLIPRGSLPEAVTLFTAAKYAEEGPPAKVQLWVDASAPQWHKSDVREFMNPRVLSRHWAGGPYTDTHDQRDQAVKLARTLETTVLKCTDRLEVFASDYGSDGSELGGELLYWLSELVADRKEARRGV